MKKLNCIIVCTILSTYPISLFAQTVAAANVVETDARLGETSTIKGRLLTTDDKPAAEVNVVLKPLNAYAVTDENGDFIFKNIQAGSYRLSTSMVGLQPVDENITVTTGQTLHLTLRLPQNFKQLEEVIVTATRRLHDKPATIDKAGIGYLDLPQSLAVIGSKVIKDQQANKLGDIIKNVGGVSLTQQRQGVAETFSARGYSIGIGGSAGSIFKNGVLTNTMGFPEASALEAVEVVKGSSALMYGNTSGGVVINMVTKKPKFEQGGEISFRAGSYDFYKSIIDVYGPFTKKLAYRAIATAEKSNSYRDGVKSKRVYVSPSLLYQISKNTSLLLQTDYLTTDLTPDYGIGILNQNIQAIIPPSRSRFINFSWANYHLDQGSGSLTFQHVLNDRWKYNFIAAAQSTKVDAYGSSVPNAIAANGDFIRTLGRTKTSEQDYTLQTNLTGNFTTAFIKHQLLIGADAERVVTASNAFEYVTNHNITSATYDTINILLPQKFVARGDIPEARDTALTTSPSNRFGVYLQDLISITNKIKVLAGLRWSYLKTYQTNIYNKLSETERKGTVAAVETDAFSPKIALIFQPITTTSLYAAYTNSFGANTGIDIYGAQLRPSITDQFEAGIKTELLKGKLSANVSVYQIINHNFAQMAALKADGSVNSDTNVKELSGETTSKGFDIDVNGIIANGIYFIAGYGYNDMRYTKTSGLKGAYIEGERLTNNPYNTANATLFYTFNHALLKGFKLGASAFYTGARFGGNQNTIGQTPDYNRLIPLTAFTTIDLSAGYNYKKISVVAKISNITNTLNYLSHERYSINPIAPRELTATIMYRL